MILSVNITGDGTVSGGGALNTGATATLLATAVTGWIFKSFEIGGTFYTANPYSFLVSTQDITVNALFYVTFENYISGKIGFEISDLALNSIRIKRNIAFAADVTTLTIRTLELAEADALMWYATSSSSYTGVKDSDGGWSHQDASYSLSSTDRSGMRSTALSLYRKWGENNGYGTIRLVNL